MDKRYTVIVNSCDSYADLWEPFFTLYKKYWNPEARLILNTESLNYTFPGLNIECVHPPQEKCHYGARIMNVLRQVSTPFVVLMLDDFFIRQKVEYDEIDRILKIMDKEPDIAYFNCDYELGKTGITDERYQGYSRLQPGREYTLNMQAAIWRTDILLAFWKPKVTPWEWELYTNIYGALSSKYRFFCASTSKDMFIDYGYNQQGMGVFRGKWVKDDVVGLFESEDLIVDFSKRGFFEADENGSKHSNSKNGVVNYFFSQFDIIYRCIPSYIFEYILYVLSEYFHKSKKYLVKDFINHKLKSINN